MVGGLVQEQDVGAREEDFGQLDAHVPPLGEGFREAAQFIGLESQSEEHLLRLRLRGKPAFQRQAVVELIEAVDEACIFGRFVVLALPQLGGDVREFGLHVVEVVEDGEYLFHDGVAAVVLHDLGQIADAHARGLFDAAGGGLLLPGDEFHEGTLAGAVLSDEAYLVSVGDVEVNAVQQVIAAEGYRYVIDRYHAFLQRRMDSSYRP